MNDIIIRVERTCEGTFIAEVEGQPINAGGHTPFAATGNLLRKIEDTRKWLKSMDLIHLPTETDRFLSNVSGFCQYFSDGNEVI